MMSNLISCVNYMRLVVYWIQSNRSFGDPVRKITAVDSMLATMDEGRAQTAHVDMCVAEMLCSLRDMGVRQLFKI